LEEDALNAMLESIVPAGHPDVVKAADWILNKKFKKVGYSKENSVLQFSGVVGARYCCRN